MVNLTDGDGRKVQAFSVDEKLGIQATMKIAPDVPTVPGEDGNAGSMRAYEYGRMGTLSLLAGIDLQTGDAIPLVSPTHESSDYVRFLEKLDARYPEGDVMRIVLDDLRAHSSAQMGAYLDARRGRFEFVFTPRHASCLNLVEGFFSKMTKQILRHIRVASKEEVEERIYRYFDEANADSVINR